MKYDLIVRYAGQEHIWKDLEMNDEIMLDESYGPGRNLAIMENNELCELNFVNHATLEIRRHA